MEILHSMMSMPRGTYPILKWIHVLVKLTYLHFTHMKYSSSLASWHTWLINVLKAHLTLIFLWYEMTMTSIIPRLILYKVTHYMMADSLDPTISNTLVRIYVHDLVGLCVMQTYISSILATYQQLNVKSVNIKHISQMTWTFKKVRAHVPLSAFSFLWNI